MIFDFLLRSLTHSGRLTWDEFLLFLLGIFFLIALGRAGKEKEGLDDEDEFED